MAIDINSNLPISAEPAPAVEPLDRVVHTNLPISQRARSVMRRIAMILTGIGKFLATQKEKILTARKA